MRSLVREVVVAALVEAPSLSSRYAANDPDFSPSVARWLARLEESLGRLRHPLTGFVAAQRGQLYAAADGFRPASVTATGRRAQRATAAVILAGVEPPLRAEVAAIDAAFAQPREQLAQLVAVAVTHDRVPPRRDPREAWLEAVWAELPDGNGAAGVREYLAARLARVDRLYVLDEVMRNLGSDGDG